MIPLDHDLPPAPEPKTQAERDAFKCVRCGKLGTIEYKHGRDYYQQCQTCGATYDWHYKLFPQTPDIIPDEPGISVDAQWRAVDIPILLNNLRVMSSKHHAEGKLPVTAKFMKEAAETIEHLTMDITGFKYERDAALEGIATANARAEAAETEVVALRKLIAPFARDWDDPAHVEKK